MPEPHLPRPRDGKRLPIVPDLAGWRAERMPEVDPEFVQTATVGGDALVHVAPFERVAIDLARLWFGAPPAPPGDTPDTPDAP